MEATTDNIQLLLKAGEPGKQPEAMNCQTQITYRMEQVEKVKQQLTERGVPRSLFDGKQHLIVVELNCNPGNEKELVQELSRILDKQANLETETIFHKVAQMFDESNMVCKVFESQNKVYLVAHEEEPRQYSQESKVKAFYDHFRPSSNLTLSLSIEGHKETRVQEGQSTQSLAVSYFDFNLEYPNLKELGSKQFKYLQAIKEEFPLIGLLPQMKRVNIRAKMSSLEEIAKSMGFQLSSEDVLDLFEQGKVLIQNEFRVYYFNQAGCLIDTTAKMDDLRFMLSNYLFKSIDYIDRLF